MMQSVNFNIDIEYNINVRREAWVTPGSKYPIGG